MRTLWVLVFVLITKVGMGQGERYATTQGIVTFTSNAPLELIEARSGSLLGIIDTDENTFAFSVRIQTFEGFNAPLQREHFNENYMESDKYPTCTFSGKIIEDIDLTDEGTYAIRAKGKLSLHGVDQERIIKSEVRSREGKLQVESNFTILLQEHNISIPKIVYQKIAEEIQVRVRAELAKD